MKDLTTTQQTASDSDKQTIIADIDTSNGVIVVGSYSDWDGGTTTGTIDIATERGSVLTTSTGTITVGDTAPVDFTAWSSISYQGQELDGSITFEFRAKHPDSSTWSAWTSDITTLSERQIEIKATLTANSGISYVKLESFVITFARKGFEGLPIQFGSTSQSFESDLNTFTSGNCSLYIDDSDFDLNPASPDFPLGYKESTKIRALIKMGFYTTAGNEYLEILEGIVNDWTQSDNRKVNAAIRDYSDLLKNKSAETIKDGVNWYTNESVEFLLSRILESEGFVDYNIEDIGLTAKRSDPLVSYMGDLPHTPVAFDSNPDERYILASKDNYLYKITIDGGFDFEVISDAYTITDIFYWADEKFALIGSDNKCYLYDDGTITEQFTITNGGEHTHEIDYYSYGMRQLRDWWSSSHWDWVGINQFYTTDRGTQDIPLVQRSTDGLKLEITMENTALLWKRRVYLKMLIRGGGRIVSDGGLDIDTDELNGSDRYITFEYESLKAGEEKDFTITFDAISKETRPVEMWAKVTKTAGIGPEVDLDVDIYSYGEAVKDINTTITSEIFFDNGYLYYLQEGVDLIKQDISDGTTEVLASGNFHELQMAFGEKTIAYVNEIIEEKNSLNYTNGRPLIRMFEIE